MLGEAAGRLENEGRKGLALVLRSVAGDLRVIAERHEELIGQGNL